MQECAGGTMSAVGTMEQVAVRQIATRWRDYIRHDWPRPEIRKNGFARGLIDAIRSHKTTTKSDDWLLCDYLGVYDHCSECEALRDLEIPDEDDGYRWDCGKHEGSGYSSLRQLIGGRLPDAWGIVVDHLQVFVWEVEDTHKLSIAKLSMYSELFWALDVIGWQLHLFSTDRYGMKWTSLNGILLSGV